MLAQRAVAEGWEGSGQVPFLLAEQRRGWSLMDLLCSRNARPGKALVGRAQWKINQPPSLEREQASLEGPCISFDPRSKEQPWPLPLTGHEKDWTPSPGLMARLGKSIAKQSEGWVGEKYLPVGGRVRSCTQWKINQPPSLRDNERAWREDARAG